ncbi:MAG TPA: invasin domain 3-containing protein, partial [Caldisericia bacterium]|nr:invasin domain 3-containing protein [Caldisericia bacterium]
MSKLIKILLIVIFTSSVVSFSVLNKSVKAEKLINETVKLGSNYALLAKALGVIDKNFLGDGSWKYERRTDKFEVFFPTYDLGEITIDDIQTIKFHTNKPLPTNNENPYNFYLVIYTKPDGINDNNWYGYRLIAEPYYSENINAPADSWIEWTTDSGSSNHLRFYDPDTTGSYGSYTDPFLQNIQQGPINWKIYYNGYPETNIDYGSEKILWFSFQTGSGWTNNFDGYLDGIIINFKNGNSLTIDLEDGANPVWVNDDWVGKLPGYEISPGKFYGYNAFDKIQDGVNVVTSSGTVYVAAGTYHEAITINKSSTLQGENKEETIIDGESNIGQIVTIKSSNVSITEFTIRNAKDYGIFINELTTPIKGIQISDNIVHDISYQYGAAIAGQRFSGEIVGNEIYNGGSTGINLAALDGDVNVNITNNSIHNNIEGIFFWAESGYFVNANIIGNEICNNKYGVYLYNQIGNIVIHENIIYGNTEYGVFNNVSKIVDATLNWWGANDGPGGVGSGSGNGVNENVDFDPWLILDVSADPTTIPADGLSTSNITAQFKDNYGVIPDDIGNLPTMLIHFTTDKGTINPTEVNTDSSGRATTTLTSLTTPCIAKITASAPPYTPNSEDSIFVEFTTLCSISGYKWNDLNEDGIWDENEPPISGWEIYIDLNNNGYWNEDEPKTLTDENGFYSFIIDEVNFDYTNWIECSNNPVFDPSSKVYYPSII